MLETADSRTANTLTKRLNFSATNEAGGLNVIADQDNDTAYVIVDTDDAVVESVDIDDDENPSLSGNERTLEDDDTYEVTVTLDAERQIGAEEVDEDDSINTTVDVIERDLTFDASDAVEINDIDAIVLRTATDQVVSGTTTIAPGTEVQIRLAGNESDPLFETDRITVSSDRTFETVGFDFSPFDGGQNFTASAPSEDFEDNAETPGTL